MMARPRAGFPPRDRRTPRYAVALAVALAGVVSAACTSPAEPPRIAAIDFRSPSITLDALGAADTMIATARDRAGTAMPSAPITWTSTAPTIATVSAAGVITAVANGEALVRATAEGIVGTLVVRVAQAPAAPVLVNSGALGATVGNALAAPVQVRVQDRLGSPMADREVTFVVVAGGGTVGTAGARSGTDGIAATSWTLGTSTTGAQTLRASVFGGDTPLDITAVALAGAPDSLAYASDAVFGQMVLVGTAVPYLPRVRILDAYGNGVPGQPVTFAVTAGGGTITGAVDTTDATGLATPGSWIVGSSPGSNVITVSAGSFPSLVFAITGYIDPCSLAGATPLPFGTVAGTISNFDCLQDGLRYVRYRLDLAATDTVALEMRPGSFESQLDSYLELFDSSGTTRIASADDLVPGEDLTARIARPLAAGRYYVVARQASGTSFGAYALHYRKARLGVPAALRVVAGDNQVAAPGATAAVQPTVRVVDEVEYPVAGITVGFAVAGGVGAVGAAQVTSDASGLASAPWTLGAGPNVLMATRFDVRSALFNAKGKASTTGFDIALRFVAEPSAAHLAAFAAAVVRWEAVITTDVASTPLSAPLGTCYSDRAIDETVDDVVIIVRLAPIDGVGSVLGSAGPCVIRGPATSPAAQAALPVLGAMFFDTADLASMTTNGTLGAVILHEMAHVLGVGTIWANKGLLKNPSPTTGTGLDTYFDGIRAITAFDSLGGATYSGSKVPVENDQGGAGTRNAHWRESVLLNELMTGFISSTTPNPLSRITIGSLGDLGYGVDLGQADAFGVNAGFRLPDTAQQVELVGDVLRIPIVVLGRSGRVPPPRTKPGRVPPR